MTHAIPDVEGFFSSAKSFSLDVGACGDFVGPQVFNCQYLGNSGDFGNSQRRIEADTKIIFK